MKHLLTALVILTAFSDIAAAQSREQQVYYPYALAVRTTAAEEQIQTNQQAQNMGTLRVYPGREAYVNHFGPLPRHPGDYRDAVDRGQWGTRSAGSRSFSVD